MPTAKQTATPPEHVWYASYGSNMHTSRLGYYLRGGRPAQSARAYPGCREDTPPARIAPVELPGSIYFALESGAWTGGLALYDPRDEGTAAARAYLISTSQFSDLAAQEMYRAPGTDLDLDHVLRFGADFLGPGRYETLVCSGWLDGFPVLTFTAPWRSADVAWNPPSAEYLRNLARGLTEAYGWPPERIAAYLCARPGAAGVWTREDVAALLA